MSQQTRLGKLATSVFENGSYTCIKYHETVVVKFNSVEIILATGGWYTATTKTRMNQAAHQYGLGINVLQIKGTWFVRLPDGKLTAFTEGMRIGRALQEVA